MYIARILYPVKVLGPGNRIAIWFDGCKHKCKGCSNPELWEFDDRYKTNVNNIMDLVTEIAKKNQVDGITLTGGDPFEQPEALESIIDAIRVITNDIIVYTGYEYLEIKDKFASILSKISLLIDGKYEEDKNEGAILRGSYNQKIICLNKEYKGLYENYLKENTSSIQNFYIDKSVISVGIHKPGYDNKLEKILGERGLII